MRVAFSDVLSVLLSILLAAVVGAQATTIRVTDTNSKLFWDVQISGGSPVSGSYVMGEPWIALGPGQTASVIHVGQWSILPNVDATFPGGLVGPYPGPLTPVAPSTAFRHGTMLNPRGGGTPDATTGEVFAREPLGYDDRVGSGFSPSKFIPVNDPSFLGLNVTAGDTVVSTVSNSDTSCTNCTNANSWTDIWANSNGDPCVAPPPGNPNGPSCSTCPTQWAGALSILSSVPPAGAFRKPCAMHSTAQRLSLPHLTTASIDWSQLPRLAWPPVPAGCNSPHASFGCFPHAGMYVQMFAGAWLDHWADETAENNVNPSMHIPGYGEYTKRIIHTAACLTALNPDAITAGVPSATAPTSQEFVRMVYGMLQAGIDIAGLMYDYTHSFRGSGGKVGGRKFLVAFANKMFAANAYPAMGGFLTQTLTGAPSYSAPRWCVWRLASASTNGYRAWERFQEDVQYFQPANPLASAGAGRLDWEWSGSPWKYCSNEGFRNYQHVAPNQWSGSTGGPTGAEAKRWDSLPCTTALGIALRLLDMQALWQNAGSPGNAGLQELLHLQTLPNEPLHPFFGYIDRMMGLPSRASELEYAMGGHNYWLNPIPPHVALPNGCLPAGGAPHPNCPDLLQRKADEWNTNHGPSLTLALWDGRRPQQSNGVEIKPPTFTFVTPAPSGPACTSLTPQTYSPTLLCQFPPRTGKPVLIEMYAGEPFLGAPSPSQTWVALLAYSLPVTPWTFFMGTQPNAVTLFVDPNAPTIVDHTNAYGFLGVPIVLNMPVSSQIVLQAVFTNWDGSDCVAASNALELTIQP